jgi:Calx-beta domain
VSYATANGTAIAGSDYVAASGTLTFAPGTTSQTVVVTVNGDTVPEGNETFLVNLGSPSNATIARGQGTGTILNDDAAPGSITLVSPNGGENWRRGQSRTIQWTSTGVTGSVRIDLARDGVNYTETIAGSTANDGVDRWTVTGPATNTARIRVCTVDLAVCDASNAAFRIR